MKKTNSFLFPKSKPKHEDIRIYADKGQSQWRLHYHVKQNGMSSLQYNRLREACKSGQ